MILFDFDIDDMLYVIKPEENDLVSLKKILSEHPEVKFASLVGVDIGGHDTDEKIPIEAFLKNYDKLMAHGVQTDGSSVVLPKIANLNNAKVDIIPDKTVNWYIDHNLKHIDTKTGFPVGTLRIPSYLLHNDVSQVGARVVLRDGVRAFKQELMEFLKKQIGRAHV